MMSQLSILAAEMPPAEQTYQIDWTLGWRYEEHTTADGNFEMRRIPLTEEEARHPKEGYIMPERTSHADIAIELRNMLRVWSVQHSDISVFIDLIFEWDHPEIGNYAPDIAVVPNVRNPEQDRGTFVVAQEGTRPCLIIEVVSPKTRKTDREDKVRDYALLGIQEYVYIYSRTTKRGIVSELVGYRLVHGSYQQIPIDEDGALYCETVSLRIGVLAGRVWVEDSATGKELLGHVEAAQAYAAAEERAASAEERATSAEERAAAETAARQLAEQRAAELEAQLLAIRPVTKRDQ